MGDDIYVFYDFIESTFARHVFHDYGLVFMRAEQPLGLLGFDVERTVPWTRYLIKSASLMMWNAMYSVALVIRRGTPRGGKVFGISSSHSETMAVRTDSIYKALVR